MPGPDHVTLQGYKDRHHDATTVSAFASRRDVPMEDARALLTAHLTSTRGEFRALGAPDFDIRDHHDSFFAHFDAVLPPRGAYLLAHDAAGRAVGTGALRRISDEAAEMKHLYVRPDARGQGLGHRLIEARIAIARGLGLRTLVADTFAGNMPMIRLYRAFGFDEGEAVAYDSAVAQITPALIPHLHFFRLTL